MTGERHHFIIDPREVTTEGRFRLNGSEAHHLSRVVRLKVGEEITLLDGTGNAFQGIIDQMEGGTVSGQIFQTVEEYNEPEVKIHLGLGNLKGSKLTAVVEKGTELGIHSLTPLIMRYGVKTGFSRDRLERVALAAIKQCGRGRVPEIDTPMAFEKWCSRLPRGRSVFTLNSPSSRPLVEWLDDLDGVVSDVWITVGPEGGYHPDEERAASRLGIPSVSLGPRRLRSETAAITAVAVCDTYFSGKRSLSGRSLSE